MKQPTLALISMNSIPPVIRGFEAISFEGLRICPNGELGGFSLKNPVLPCEKGLREWWITNYIAEPSTRTP
jgi:hypothetical protein